MDKFPVFLEIKNAEERFAVYFALVLFKNRAQDTLESLQRFPDASWWFGTMEFNKKRLQVTKDLIERMGVKSAEQLDKS